MSLENIFKMAYKMEIQGMNFYSAQKDRVKLPILKETFDYLQKMEKNHADYLQRQIDNVSNEKTLDDLPTEEDDKFRERMKKQLIDVRKLDSDLGDYSIIRMAYLIEKDFAEFYRKSAESQKEEKTKQLFNTLSEWEVGHAEMMKDHLENIIERNNMDLGFYPY
jgi:rubrerythrin